MIILDLEWNSGCGAECFNEILQIGAVRINQLGGKIVDTFCVYIKPCVLKEFSPPAQGLPDLQLSIDSLVDLSSGISSFFQWCGDDSEFASWGLDDFGILAENIDYCKQHYTLPDKLFDLQSAFSSTLYTEARIALYKAVTYCKIPAIFDFHNALHDALYAATIGESIPTNFLLNATFNKKSHKSIGNKKGKKHGPFATIEKALNNRGCRHPQCPKCEKKIGLSHWFYLNELQYYSQFSCIDHGKYIYYLELYIDVTSCWRVETSVLEACEENLSTYRSVKKANVFRCIQLNHSKKRYYQVRKNNSIFAID